MEGRYTGFYRWLNVSYGQQVTEVGVSPLRAKNTIREEACLLLCGLLRFLAGSRRSMAATRLCHDLSHLVLNISSTSQCPFLRKLLDLDHEDADQVVLPVDPGTKSKSTPGLLSSMPWSFSSRRSSQMPSPYFVLACSRINVADLNSAPRVWSCSISRMASFERIRPAVELSFG